MAGAIPKRGGVQRMMECPVCLLTYNTRDRLPKALRCYHTLCGACVLNLIKEGQVSCPKCRSVTDAGDVGTNYTLTDILDALCENCVTRDRDETCGHCRLSLCSSCLKRHSRTIHEELKSELDKLCNELSGCTDALNARGSRMREVEDGIGDLHSQIKSTFAAHRKTLNDYEKKLVAQVQEISGHKVQAHINWRNNLYYQIGHSKKFIDQTHRKIGAKYSQNVGIQDLTELQATCASVSKELVDAKAPKGYYVTTKFSFVSKNMAMDGMHHALGQIVKVSGKDPVIEGTGETEPAKTTVGNISPGSVRPSTLPTSTASSTTTASASTSGSSSSDTSTCALTFPRKSLNVVQQFVQKVKLQLNKLEDRATSISTSNSSVSPLIRNYQSATFDFSVGRQGFGRGQFNRPWGIKQTEDGYVVVSDTLGHRIQVFDPNLQFMWMFGKKGHGTDRFQEPTGITISSRNVIFVSDCVNNRIQVCSIKGGFLHRFGSYGKINGQFDGPLGIDHYNDHLYVCDSGNHRIQVLTVDGLFVRKFGPDVNGLFSHEPYSIKVTNSQMVLVGESGGSDQCIHVFSLTGDYLSVYSLVYPSHCRTEFINPNGLAVDAEGNILVTDDTGVIKIIGEEGCNLGKIKPKNYQLNCPHGIIVDLWGNILVCDLHNHRVVQFTVDQN